LESGNIGIIDTMESHFSNEFKYIERLTACLNEWSEVVNQKLNGIDRKTSLIKESHQDIFVSFNYTTTLEDIYNILECNVLHIHGVVDSDNELVLGHSDVYRITYFTEKYRDYESRYDEQSAPIYKVLA